MEKQAYKPDSGTTTWLKDSAKFWHETFFLSFAHGSGPRDARAGLSQKPLGGEMSSVFCKDTWAQGSLCLLFGGHSSCQQPSRRELWTLLRLLWSVTHVLSAVIRGHLAELSSFYIAIIAASPTVSAMVSLPPEILTTSRLVFCHAESKTMWSRLKEK